MAERRCHTEVGADWESSTDPIGHHATLALARIYGSSAEGLRNTIENKLIAAVRSEDTQKQGVAIRTLGEIGNPKPRILRVICEAMVANIRKMAVLLERVDATTAGEAIRALGLIGKPDALVTNTLFSVMRGQVQVREVEGGWPNQFLLGQPLMHLSRSAFAALFVSGDNTEAAVLRLLRQLKRPSTPFEKASFQPSRPGEDNDLAGVLAEIRDKYVPLTKNFGERAARAIPPAQALAFE